MQSQTARSMSPTRLPACRRLIRTGTRLMLATRTTRLRSLPSRSMRFGQTFGASQQVPHAGRSDKEAQVVLNAMTYIADDNSGASTANQPMKELLSDV